MRPVRSSLRRWPVPRTGRPTKLTPETQTKIVNLLRAGNYVETAAAFCDIDKPSIYDWLKRGNRQKTGIYRDFLNAVERAQAEAEIRDLEAIRKDGAWQGSAWRLERKFPQKWGRKERLEHVGTDGGPIQVATIRFGGRYKPPVPAEGR